MLEATTFTKIYGQQRLEKSWSAAESRLTWLTGTLLRYGMKKRSLVTFQERSQKYVRCSCEEAVQYAGTLAMFARTASTTIYAYSF